MSRQAGSSNNSSRLDLNGELTIQRIAELKQQLCSALQDADGLVLNLKEVSRADLTFLQLLCSAHRSAQAAGKFLRCEGVSAAVDKAVSDAGFLRGNMACGQDCSDSCLWIEA